MGSTFNPQILVEKLAKLNGSQTSIETLSHWCIFHMNKAKQVVETWDRQFHCSPREKRLAFLYLANDILQNSRRKGSEFVGEFWKVLPDALRDVIQSGDDFARNAALRLIGIWEERKVFGSRGQILKEEFVGRHVENNSRDVKPVNMKLRPSAGNALEKIVSGYHVVYGGQTDEDAVLSKCRNAISCLEKADKEIGHDGNSGRFHGSALVDELQGHSAALKDCIEQLTTIESSRASLVSHLREALQDQEFKLGQVRSQIQAARVQSEQAGNTCRQLLNANNIQSVAEQNSKEIQTSMAPSSFVISGDREQSAPLMYAPQVSFPQKSGHTEEDPRKSAAAAVAAKLTASTSSAQMLSYVLSSLASEGVIGNPMKESSADYQSEKRTKLENDQPAYIPSQNPQQPLPPFSVSESIQHNAPTTNQQSTPIEPPPPPSSSPPPLPPLPPMPQYPVPQFMQTAGSISSMAYSYGMTQQPSMAAYPGVGASLNGVSPFTPPLGTYQGFQGSDGNYYNQPSSMPMAPISRQ
ncbi:regulation of nuclear pre-mRNA domain-containing protein 1A [Abrus precatorius]|uniref:Regulation of nuclear pre-mRNA domain-containing protein 1A n=1 Tax=Abrus precatorius TaxID=3816 RepID=A0A8B8L690_ABRPR|nr:regulation of nuclear pre-mRNA domain-containing protein 1A [Abrus precatorius]XP_027350913.1 regulation of nuclear pre-mRNA domain-containing protein 1A [Abrus precatorius]XP_027350914.1 regulation of nuclear pre-mRNA domain-containing protein 1A [Abrus precatorius]XP_027350915.1 regulation of nuclear pre-mRNA domain-containing protein 1A [Abrus precatorius]